jgi:vitamin-K-epoxide reductase (warfarin-sensitive)
MLNLLKELYNMISTVMIVMIIGLIISIYGIVEERKMKQDAMYKPACDITDKISCSRVFLSSYSTTFGISNIWIATAYYCTLIVLSFMQITALVTALAYAGVAVSFVFAYIMFFKVRAICPVCVSLYIVNIVIGYLCWC